jgi:hypothetical protein
VSDKICSQVSKHGFTVIRHSSKVPMAHSMSHF